MQRARHFLHPPARLGLASGFGVRQGIELWPTFALLGVYAVVYVQNAVQLAGFPFDLDQGEGYDAWSAWMVNLGQLPYTSNAEFPYYSSNYPPVWSYLVSIPMAWLGPGLASARLAQQDGKHTGRRRVHRGRLGEQCREQSQAAEYHAPTGWLLQQAQPDDRGQ